MNEVLIVTGWFVLVSFALALTVVLSAQSLSAFQYGDTEDKTKGSIAVAVILVIWWFVFHISPFSITIQYIPR